MACTRNRVINLIDYLNDCGIVVNIGKNKAGGHKGIFKTNGNLYRIDIAKNSDDETILSTLIHEFIHFVHYKYDRNLKNLDFIFDNYTGDYIEELRTLTVDSIPKSSVEPLFSIKSDLEKMSDVYYNEIKPFCKNFKKSKPCKEIEKEINKYDIKYLLKYDKIKIVTLKGFKTYSIENIDSDFAGLDKQLINYVKLKSTQRKLRRINSRISRLNKYYNTPTELLARSFEYYSLKPPVMKQKTLELYKYYKKIIENNKIPMLTEMYKFL